MIPLRIRLSGFMSYRDEQELSFEGATLWMLAGQNGAGKSAVFDAMTYTLYDQHRLGAQHADELINKECDELRVDFEFRCGEDTYRIVRTLSRRQNHATRQALHIEGPHAPNPAITREQHVLGTESAQGFKDWVRQTIGLDYSTFTASVLLCQGKTDALLEADPKGRHIILSQIVDLAVYERLQQAAEGRRKAGQAKADLLQDQFRAIEPVTGVELATAEQRMAVLDAELKAAHEALLHLAWLKGEAKRWEQLSKEQTELRSTLAAAADLLAQADVIESQAARLAELRRVLPLLAALLETRDRLRVNESAIDSCDRQIADAKVQAKEAQRSLEEQTAAEVALQREHAEHARTRGNAQTELVALQPQLTLIAQIEEQRRQLADADTQLEAYPIDLDQLYSDLASAVAQLETAAQALPWLEELAAERAKRLLARDALCTAQERLTSIVEQIPADLAADGITSAEFYAEHEQQAVATAQANLKQVEERLKRLRTVEGKPTCDYCGQPLTGEHIAKEHERLAVELAQAREALGRARASHALARRLKLEEAEARQEWNTAGTGVQLAQHRAESALKALPAIYRERAMATPEPEAVTAARPHPYPSPGDLDLLRSETAQLADAQHELATVKAQYEQHRQQQAIRQQLAAYLAALEERCPPDVALQARTQANDATNRMRVAEQAMERLKQPLDEAARCVAVAELDRDDARNRLRTAEAGRGALFAQREELKRNAREKLAAVPEGWRAVCERLTPEQVAAWELESRQLAGAEARATELADARSKRAVREEHLERVVALLGEIPPEAYCAVSSIEAREHEATDRHDAARLAYERAGDEYKELAHRKERRAELEQQRDAAARQAYLYGMLARLLGRDYLQRHLLLQAESSIVEHANRVLDRISTNALRLELRVPKEGAHSGQKALDLVAYNILSADKPLLVGALSGSQRFRVAVSLALGIGEFASEGNRRIETVMIDEGFGSLDRQGRQDMIAELQTLKSELRRVILVSHQEEFTDKFTRGYYIELTDGTSQVSDLERRVLDLDADTRDVLELADVDVSPMPVTTEVSL